MTEGTAYRCSSRLTSLPVARAILRIVGLRNWEGTPPNERMGLHGFRQPTIQTTATEGTAACMIERNSVTTLVVKHMFHRRNDNQKYKFREHIAAELI